MTKLSTTQQAILNWMAEDPFNNTISVTKLAGTTHDGLWINRYVKGRRVHMQRKTFKYLRPYLKQVDDHRARGWSIEVYALAAPPA